ncbi:MAG TPA: hypothetical protein VJI46_00320 [Candidatus Nanoarchaeia archaeon]|nr:hypothetical protein [Candidatus Nanoarchaeia archaeon]
MNKNMILIAVLVVLVVVAVVQAVQLFGLKGDLAGTDLNAKSSVQPTQSGGASSGASSPANIANLPSMVGGC